MTFGARLRRVMSESSVSSAALSRATGISPANVSHMLAGRLPAHATLCKVLKALPDTINVRVLILGSRTSK